MIQRQTFNKIIITLASFSSLFSWWIVQRAVTSNSSSDWTIAAIGLSVVFISISLIIVLVKNPATAELVVFCSLAASFPFAFQISHAITVIIAILFAIVAVRRIRRDFELNVKIDIWKSLRMGKGFLLGAFSLVLASQYYADALKNIENKQLPHIEVGQTGGKIAMQIISSFNPGFAALQDEEITVDDFILESWEKQKQDGAVPGGDSTEQAFIEQQLDKNGVPSEEREILRLQAQERLKQMRDGMTEDNRDLILSEGRKQFSEMLGREIAGTEKMSEVFSGIVDKKINDFFSPNPQFPERAKAYPMLVSILLFLTMLSLTSILWWLVVAIVAGIFEIKKKIGVVKISWTTVEAETIE